MRILLRFALSALCGVLPLAHAHAQATVDPRALQSLQPPAPVKQEPPATTPRRPPVRPAPRPPARPAPARPPAKPIPAPAPAPPPLPVVPPPVEVPTRPIPAPAPAPVVATAPGLASSIPHGRRITFGEGGSDLNPDTEAALREAVHAAPAGPNTTFTITAYAAGTPEDPSTARRLSLSRALAVRSVLIAEGIPSVRIYVKALGSTTPGFAEGPADRVDLTVAFPADAPPAPPTAVPMPPADVPMPPSSAPTTSAPGPGQVMGPPAPPPLARPAVPARR